MLKCIYSCYKLVVAFDIRPSPCAGAPLSVSNQEEFDRKHWSVGKQHSLFSFPEWRHFDFSCDQYDSAFFTDSFFLQIFNFLGFRMCRISRFLRPWQLHSSDLSNLSLSKMSQILSNLHVFETHISSYRSHKFFSFFFCGIFCDL